MGNQFSLQVGVNDLETWCKENDRLDLLEQWSPMKNGTKNPMDYSKGSREKIWWLLSYDDPQTGKHFDFEWKYAIQNRTNGNTNCPFLSNQEIWVGFNDLCTTNTELAKE